MNPNVTIYLPGRLAGEVAVSVVLEVTVVARLVVSYVHLTMVVHP